MSANSDNNISIIIPNIRNIPDSEMPRIAGLRDGRWSSTTKALLQRFGTNKLNLNTGWAATWESWSCPCCGRYKSQIARLSAGNVLLCNLEEHHDHLVDHCKTIYREAMNDLPEGDDRVQMSRAEGYLMPLIERFARILICNDCNHAEGRIKYELVGEIERNFTFTTSEIVCFIEVEENRPHGIDFGKARQIWQSAKADYHDRIEFARMMAHRIADGRHRREARHAPVPEMQRSDRDIVHDLVRGALPDLWRLHLGEHIQARSISRDGAGSSMKPRRPTAVLAPTDREYAEVDRVRSSESKYWRNTGEDWRCPCCNRGKRETVRKSNRGRWTAGIHQVREYEPERRPDALEWRRLGKHSCPVIGGYSLFLICQDCRDISAALMRRHVQLFPECLTLENRRELAGAAQENASYDTDFLRAFDLATENEPLVSGIMGFLEHRREVRHMKAEILRIHHQGCSLPHSRKLVAAEKANSGQCDEHCADSYVKWMLEEEERLDNLEKAERTFNSES